MKFKTGQLAVLQTIFGPQICIVLGREALFRNRDDIYYKVYLIKHQRANYTSEQFLSPMNPQEVESEV